MPSCDKSFLFELKKKEKKKQVILHFLMQFGFLGGKKEHAWEFTKRQKVRRVSTNKICLALRSHKHYFAEIVTITVIN